MTAATAVKRRRLPLAPLETLAADRHVLGSLRLAEVAGVCPSVVRRWRTTGVDVWQADRLAVAFGVHPLSVWPDWLDPEYEAPAGAQLVLFDEPVGRQRRCPQCFNVVRKGARFHVCEAP